MKITEPKFSKRLDKEIYPRTPEFVAWCKVAKKPDVEAYIQEEYEKDIEFYVDHLRKRIKEGYKEVHGEPCSPERLEELVNDPHQRQMGGDPERYSDINKDYLKELISEVKTSKSVVADADKLFRQAEQAIIKNEMEWFFENYQKTLNNEFSNRKGARTESTTIDNVLRFRVAEEKQYSLLSRQKQIWKLLHSPGPHYLREVVFKLPPVDGQYMMEEHEIEKGLQAELQKLLSRKSYRDAINFVFSEVLDVEKTVKFKKETAVALQTSVQEAEDAYKIGRRARGSAYSGKKQR
jgi:hypothetical protein